MNFDFQKIAGELTNIILKSKRITTKEAYEKFAPPNTEFELWKAEFYKAMDGGTLPGFERSRGRFGGIRLAEVDKTSSVVETNSPTQILEKPTEGLEETEQSLALVSRKFESSDSKRIIYPQEVADKTAQILDTLKLAAQKREELENPSLKKEPVLIFFLGKEYISGISLNQTTCLIQCFVSDLEQDMEEKENVTVTSGNSVELFLVNKSVIPYLENVLFYSFKSGKMF